MKIDNLKNKKILIVGYGIEGKSTELFLKKNVSNAVIGITDKNDRLNYLDVQYEYDLVIKSPGVNKSDIHIPYTTATNIFFANIQNPIIGVTGTKGKSTTASLIHHILVASGKKAHLVGNIGKPALELFMSSIGKDDIIVMELSSYQLDDICYSPHFVVITSLFPEHMNYHGTVDLYYASKRNILSRVISNNTVFFNSKYQQITEWIKDLSIKKVDVSNLLLDRIESQLIGKHNVENILLSYAVAKELGITNSQIRNAIKTFKPLPHRLEKVGVYKEILFFNDAISTTPQSTIAAIESLKTVNTLLLGGQDRGYDFEQLMNCIVRNKITNLVFFPESGEKMYNVLKKRNTDIHFNILKTSKMDEAVSFAFQYTKKDHICLLSTASPSYSIWKNYIEKGELFKKYITEYEKK
ncbi:UDP-N-acetylmuramoyl-L-alanine--D-glutamate ligase [Candidatus Roizmanbacteria bacterium CG_4_10_14_0_8_um_filter_33_9]|uniref:UDP-N-acetylmuramoylalanine--D-glutamate ligase n=1 Tax=Candidatus Roizmanbacteria bacterium CG_4_10_14_0_8_um_filter_33_9 TaxID=1974826 RepID=A0A2M7QHK1_9BACT|nr:MAG: UDP-N-acetylmuramoyl-L-alanine--D-glutamate ligase [Candidatus Roizmanbacteria bacterium CG_4_10_14_0_8_um_filter_33_9]